jgi:hypothetical protein
MENFMQAVTLPRRFIIGLLTLEDPLPEGSLEEVQAILAQEHPSVRHTHIFHSDSRISDCSEFLDFHVVLPPVKTNG